MNTSYGNRERDDGEPMSPAAFLHAGDLPRPPILSPAYANVNPA